MKKLLAVCFVVLASIPFAATMLVLTSPAFLSAQDLEEGCQYGGQTYSSGARIANACAPGQGQVCNGSSWSSCH